MRHRPPQGHGRAALARRAGVAPAGPRPVEPYVAGLVDVAGRGSPALIPTASSVMSWPAVGACRRNTAPAAITSRTGRASRERVTVRMPTSSGRLRSGRNAGSAATRAVRRAGGSARASGLHPRVETREVARPAGRRRNSTFQPRRRCSGKQQCAGDGACPSRRGGVGPGDVRLQPSRASEQLRRPGDDIDDTTCPGTPRSPRRSSTQDEQSGARRLRAGITSLERQLGRTAALRPGVSGQALGGAEGHPEAAGAGRQRPLRARPAGRGGGQLDVPGPCRGVRQRGPGGDPYEKPPRTHEAAGAAVPSSSQRRAWYLMPAQ